MLNDNRLNGSTSLTPASPPAEPTQIPPAEAGIRLGLQVVAALEKNSKEYIAGCRKGVVDTAEELARNGRAAEGEEFLRAFDQTVQARIDSSRSGIPLRVSVRLPDGSKTEVARHG